MKLEEITLERVKEAYAKTGAKPEQCISNNRERCCPLGVLALEKHGHPFPSVMLEKVLDLDYQDTWAFIAGFDGSIRYRTSAQNPWYLRGREIAVGLGLVKEVADD